MGLMLMLLLIPGTDTMATGLMPMATPTGHMAMDTIMERGLLMPSLLPMLLLLLMLMLPLIPGMDTTAMPDPMAMVMPMGIPMPITDTTTARGLLMLRLLPLLMLRLLLIPGTDTTAMDTGPMAMDTGERSKKQDFCKTAAN